MNKLIIFFAQFLLAFCENLITFSEFRKAVTDNIYPTPTREQYDTIMSMALSAGNITSKHELAMFLAQVLWESAGLQHKKEIKCASNDCPSSYRTGKEQPGKYYYGRGYIQLTWLYNYEQCSQELYGDNRLVENPDLVSDTEEGAWGSAFWYWSKHCHNADGVKKGQFGASTMAINGVLECKGPYKVKAFKRYTIYIKVLNAFDLNNIKPSQEGCYPMEGSEAPGFRLCNAVGIHKNAVGMYHWCNDNCNAEDPNCPEDMCGCEGGNPKPKAKVVIKTETESKNEPKIEPIIEPKIEPLIEAKIEPLLIPIKIESKPQIQRQPKPQTQIRPHIPFHITPSTPTPSESTTSTPVPNNLLNHRIQSQVRNRPQSSIPKAIAETDLFRYHEPQRIRPVVSTESALNLFQYSNPIRNTTAETPVPRTQVLRNELGRLIRKRPVVRNQ